MKRASLAVVLGTALLLLPGSAAADISYPARLDVTEREPGVYDVFFTLPIVEGRKLRAEPRLPATCLELTERTDGVSSGGYASTWRVRCEPASLAGEAIFIDGLLGTQTDLAFTLTMLNGRTYSRILRPSRPGFLVPKPPALIALAREAVVAGLRRTIRYLGLWLLLATAALLGSRPRDLLVAASAFAIGHVVAQWLGGRDWLEVTPQVRDACVWASVAVGALRLAAARQLWRGWLQPLWATLFLIGLLFGGAQYEALPEDGLSHAEQLLALGLFGVGAAVALLFMVAAAYELRVLLAAANRSGRPPAAVKLYGYAAGGLAIGMLLTQLVGIAVTGAERPRAVLEFVLLAIVLGPTVVLDGRRKPLLVVVFTGLGAIGIAFGLHAGSWPLASMLTLGTLLLLGVALAVNRPLSRRWALAVGGVAVIAHAGATTHALTENVSRSTALTGGALLVASCIFYASLAIARNFRPAFPLAAGVPAPTRWVGGVTAVCVVVWRLGEYREWFAGEFATAAALGLIRLPLLALGLALLAVMLWPRRRRVAQALNVDHRSGRLHWLLLGAAFLLIPYGTLAVKNPFFAPDAPRGEDARLVVSWVLSDTYRAFNIADENTLYDTLAESVTGDLVDDLFLDSRRRLTAGTREGTEVTVRDVVVLEIGEPHAAANLAEGFSYDCRWAVVARVRHLQHIHHRKNIYNGVLTLRPDGGRWKIAGVELFSEDREVVSWQAT